MLEGRLPARQLARRSGGVAVPKRMLANEASPNVREQVVFALSRSKLPEALALVIDAAKNDLTALVHSKALCWLAQKASNNAADDVIRIATLKGAPRPIDVAKAIPIPPSAKKAIFRLGESNDPRALDYFAQILH